MDQSSSGGSGAPSRKTLTLICLFRDSSNMRANYSTQRRSHVVGFQKSELNQSQSVTASQKHARFWQKRHTRKESIADYTVRWAQMSLNYANELNIDSISVACIIVSDIDAYKTGKNRRVAYPRPAGCSSKIRVKLKIRR